MKRASRISGSPNVQQRQKGVAAVELAIILPLFVILLLGIIEIGGLARDHQILQNAAREGARFSSLPANRTIGVANGAAVETVIKNRIIAYLAAQNMTVVAGDITVNQAYTIMMGAITVNCSEITIVYNRSVLFPGINNWVPISATLRGKAVFRNFY